MTRPQRAKLGGALTIFGFAPRAPHHPFPVFFPDKDRQFAHPFHLDAHHAVAGHGPRRANLYLPRAHQFLQRDQQPIGPVHRQPVQRIAAFDGQGIAARRQVVKAEPVCAVHHRAELVAHRIGQLGNPSGGVGRRPADQALTMHRARPGGSRRIVQRGQQFHSDRIAPVQRNVGAARHVGMAHQFDGIETRPQPGKGKGAVIGDRLLHLARLVVGQPDQQPTLRRAAADHPPADGRVRRHRADRLRRVRIDKLHQRDRPPSHLHIRFELERFALRRQQPRHLDHIVTRLHRPDLAPARPDGGRAAGLHRRAAPFPGVDTHGKPRLPLHETADRRRTCARRLDGANGMPPPRRRQLDLMPVAAVQVDALHAAAALDAQRIEARRQVHKPERAVVLCQRNPLRTVTGPQQHHHRGRAPAHPPRQHAAAQLGLRRSQIQIDHRIALTGGQAHALLHQRPLDA